MSAFRGQLVLEEQRRLYDVWASAAAGAAMPTKAAFQPRAFGPLLPFISLIDTAHAASPRVRVAGSALKDVFGGDPQLMLLDPLPCLSARGPDALAGQGAAGIVVRVCREGKPACGLAALDSGGRGRAVRAWLRLPLGAGGRVEAVVGLDLALTGARVPQWALERVSGG